MGLFALKREWVPPFAVLTSEFFHVWQKTGSTKSTLESLELDEATLLQTFLQAATDSGTNVLVRSNSQEEDCLETRGKFSSSLAMPTIDSVSTENVKHSETAPVFN